MSKYRSTLIIILLLTLNTLLIFKVSEVRRFGKSMNQEMSRMSRRLYEQSCFAEGQHLSLNYFLEENVIFPKYSLIAIVGGSCSNCELTLSRLNSYYKQYPDGMLTNAIFAFFNDGKNGMMSDYGNVLNLKVNIHKLTISPKFYLTPQIILLKEGHEIIAAWAGDDLEYAEVEKFIESYVMG